jgi:hypothetical protein
MLVNRRGRQKRLESRGLQWEVLRERRAAVGSLVAGWINQQPVVM